MKQLFFYLKLFCILSTIALSSCDRFEDPIDLYEELVDELFQNELNPLFVGTKSIQVGWDYVESDKLNLFSYSLYLNDELYAENLKSNSYSFLGLQPNTIYKIRLDVRENGTKKIERDIEVVTLDDKNADNGVFKAFKIHEFTDAMLTDICKTPDGDFIGTGSFRHPGEIEIYKSVVVRFDKEMNKVWYRILDGGDGSLDIEIFDDNHAIFNYGTELCFIDIASGEITKRQKFNQGVNEYILRNDYYVVRSGTHFYRYNKSDLTLKYSKQINFSDYIFAIEIDNDDNIHCSYGSRSQVLKLNAKFEILIQHEDLVDWYDRSFYMYVMLNDPKGNMHMFGTSGGYSFRHFVYDTKDFVRLSHYHGPDWMNPSDAFIAQNGDIVVWGTEHARSGPNTAARIRAYNKDYSFYKYRYFDVADGVLTAVVESEMNVLWLFMSNPDYPHQIIRKIRFE